MQKPMERNKPLKACPDLSCRRLQTCHRQAVGKACLKTHFRNDSEFYDSLTARINRLCGNGKADPNDTRTQDELMAEVRKALDERLAYLVAVEGPKY